MKVAVITLLSSGHEQKSSQRFEELPLSKSKERDGSGTTLLFPASFCLKCEYEVWTSSSPLSTMRHQYEGRRPSKTKVLAEEWP